MMDHELLGKHLKLTGRTLRGRNKIREHGAEWIVTRYTPQCACYNKHPAILIRSVRDNDMRWIELTNDQHFDYEVLSDVVQTNGTHLEVPVL